MMQHDFACRETGAVIYALQKRPDMAHVAEGGCGFGDYSSMQPCSHADDICIRKSSKTIG